MASRADLSAASPSAASSSQGVLQRPSSQEHITLPKPKKTGRSQVDEDALAEHPYFEEMVNVLHRKRHHVMPIYLKLRERVEREEESEAIRSTGGEAFDRPMGTLRQLDEEWLVSWLVHRSRFTSTQILNAKKVDPDAPYQMAAFELQMPFGFRLPDCLRVKEVCWRAFDKRGDICGCRLANVNKDDFFLADGQLNWRHGCYLVERVDGVIKQAKHVSDPTPMVFTDSYGPDYKLDLNWLDCEAQLKKPRGRFAGVKLCYYWDDLPGQGPNKVPALTSKDTAFSAACEAVATEWKAEREKVASGAAKNADVSEQLQSMRREQKTNNLAQARQKAASELKKRKLKRHVSVSDPAAEHTQ